MTGKEPEKQFRLTCQCTACGRVEDQQATGSGRTVGDTVRALSAGYSRFPPVHQCSGPRWGVMALVAIHEVADEVGA